MVAVAAAGCGTGEHQDAVSAVKRYVAAHGGGDRVRCTSGVGLPYRLRTPDYLCTVSRGGAHCDELRATKRAAGWRVTVYRRDVDCVLPA